MQNRECVAFERTRDTEQRIRASRVNACEARVHPSLFAFVLAAYAYGCAFAR